MIRRASDLMSKYVGETEQQIAAMFARAEEERALLLLDEADSFMQSRQGAVRNYEVSEVNEMLQGMERFDGIFVCTTNLFDRIDEAALRRFAFKIRFRPLERTQRERMFITEALGGNADAMTAAWRDALASLDVLTPAISPPSSSRRCSWARRSIRRRSWRSCGKSTRSSRSCANGARWGLCRVSRRIPATARDCPRIPTGCAGFSLPAQSEDKGLA